MKQNKWMIFDTRDTNKFWSEKENGWTDFGNGTVYSDTEQNAKESLPHNGTWYDICEWDLV